MLFLYNCALLLENACNRGRLAWLGDIEQIIVTGGVACSPAARCDTFASGPIKCMRHVAGTPFNWLCISRKRRRRSRLVGEQYIIILFVCDSSFSAQSHTEFNESATHSLPNFYAHFVVCVMYRQLSMRLLSATRVQ